MLEFYNTLIGETEEFEPLEEGKLGFIAVAPPSTITFT